MTPYLGSNDRRYLAWLATYHPGGATFEQAAYGLREKGVLPSYQMPALRRLVEEGWLQRHGAWVTTWHLTEQAVMALPLARLCGHTNCRRLFVPSDDEGNQKYCRPECAKLAYRVRKDARDNNRSTTRLEGTMHAKIESYMKGVFELGEGQGDSPREALLFIAPITNTWGEPIKCSLHTPTVHLTKENFLEFIQAGAKVFPELFDFESETVVTTTVTATLKPITTTS